MPAAATPASAPAAAAPKEIPAWLRTTPPLPEWCALHLQPASSWPARGPEPDGGAFGGYLQSLHPRVSDYVPRAADAVIGRQAGLYGRSDLTIDDPYISERHAVLRFLLPHEPLRRDAGVVLTLQDSSRNGVWVNNSKLEFGATVGLKSGDILTLSKAADTVAQPCHGRIFLRVVSTVAPQPEDSSAVPAPLSQSLTIADTMPFGYDAPTAGGRGRPPVPDVPLSQSIGGPQGGPGQASRLRRTGRVWDDYGKVRLLGDGAYSKVSVGWGGVGWGYVGWVGLCGVGGVCACVCG